MSEKKQMILVETEEPKNLDDGTLQESNSPPCLPASDAPDLQESFDAKSVAPSEAKSETKSEAKSLAPAESKSLAPSEAKSEAKSVAPPEAPSSIVTSEHPYGNKRMTLVHLRQIDGNCIKVTEDVNPTADYRFRKNETEMNDSEIQQFNLDWIEFWQPEITRKQMENIHKKIK